MMSRVAAGAAALSMACHAGVAAAADVASRHNLQTPVTPIAREIYDLHLLMLWICAVIFVGRVRLHVLLVLRAPQVDRPQGGAVPREHHRRDPLDGDPGRSS